MSLLLMGMSGTASLLASEAEAYWLASQKSGEYLPDLTGNGHDARFGSVGNARVINKGRAKYLRLPGLAGNYASTPDSAALSITGDIDIRVKVALNDWTPGAINGIAGKSSYLLTIGTNGRPIYTFHNGTTFVGSTCDAAPVIVDGTALWVRVTHDVDDGAGNNVIKFWTSSDGVSWTQLGTTITTVGTVTRRDDAGALALGMDTNGTSNPMSGKYWQVQIRNNILDDGTGIVFNADFTNLADGATSFTESSSNAATVTINSTSPADTNDPTYLEYTGTKYAYLPGVAGNNITTPDSVPLSITGDIELRVKIAMDAFPGSTQHIFSKGNSGSAGAGSYLLLITGGGSLQLTIIPPVDIGVTATSTAAITLGDISVGVEIAATWRASDGRVQFFTRPLTGGAFTQLGTDRTIAVASILDTNLALGIGTRSAGDSALACRLYGAQVYNGIGGTLVFDWNANNATAPYATMTESSANAATVTFNRAATGKKLAVVDRTTLLFGTDDYLEVQNQANINFSETDNLTAVAVVRVYGSQSGNGGGVFVKRANIGGIGGGISGYINTIRSNRTLYSVVADATVRPIATSTAALSEGVIGAVTLQRSVTADTVDGAVDSAFGAPQTDTTTTTLLNTLSLFIGKSTADTAYLDGEIVGLALFRKALTPAQLLQVKTELGG